MATTHTAHQRLVIGLGETGLSCARYFHRLQLPFTVLDSRPNPPQLASYLKEFPDAPLYLGPFQAQLFQHLTELVVSPGVDLNDPILADAIAKMKVQAMGDIELFAKQTRAPIIAITGTNAKGTVTTLVGDMIHAAGRSVELGGNIGRTVLDLLTAPIPDFYVLELSSFQLETTYSLRAKVATILNISPDHLDRHKTLETYIRAKQRIYQHCEMVVWNHDDPLTYPRLQDSAPERILSFGLHMEKPHSSAFGLRQLGDGHYLVQGHQALMPVDELHIKGQHNWVNVLAALTIAHAIELPMASTLTALREFKGLTHRCQWIREHRGISWYNDSKATNVGATLAALQGLGPVISGKIILIAGGLGKGADFTPLGAAVARYVRTAILIGQDALQLQKALEKSTAVKLASDLSHAVALARQLASPGDAVLLSPACASLDMFKNYEERGDVFVRLVRAEH